jgi:hypothetical protein
MRDVLFRFGSWSYIDNVERVPRLAVKDLPSCTMGTAFQDKISL